LRAHRMLARGSDQETSSRLKQSRRSAPSAALVQQEQQCVPVIAPRSTRRELQCPRWGNIRLNT
jgi:hypothetical protein